jgi:hypothetical protein
MMIARRGERRSRESGRTVMMIGPVRRIIVMIARRHRIGVDFAAPPNAPPIAR